MEQNQSEMDAKKQSSSKAHVRKRKKQYYNRIRQQMEFYFGDANLSKDRFLNKLLAVNPYVPLQVFMNFNKMKEMSNGVEDIQKALEGSEMLELSNDRQSVRRVTEIRKKEDLDEYMVYVELLPPNSTHETVRQQFKQFGNVSYVSLPRYRTSGRIKEFAFIEFEEKSSVKKCIEAFRQFNAVIADAQDPENLKSVVAYVKEQEELENQGEGEEKEVAEDNPENKECSENKGGAEETQNDEGAKKVSQDKNDASDDQHEKGAKKRLNEEPSNIEEVPKKRTKTEKCEKEQEQKPQKDQEHKQEQEQKQEQEKDNEEDEKGYKEAQGSTTDEKASLTDENSDRKKKNRKRRKRNASQTAPNNPGGGEIIAPAGHMSIGEEVKKTPDPNQSLALLRVTTKTEWKRLCNMYLTLQRQKYTEVKKLLQLNKNGDTGKKSTLPLSTVRPVTMKPKDSPPPPKKICTRNINFYGANRDEHNANNYECSIINENKTDVEETKEVESNDKKQVAKDLQFEFEPGLIVKVNFDEPCTDVSDFKAEMKQYPFVQYVDVKEGQSHAYVRVDTARSAPTLIKRCAPIRCQILNGEVEKEYWAKIARDREQKLSKSVKVPRNRSRKMRNIIRNIAEIHVVKEADNKTTVTHIRFDDD